MGENQGLERIRGTQVSAGGETQTHTPETLQLLLRKAGMRGRKRKGR